MDASGCEICACRDCQAAKDCTSFPYPCDTPFCSESGTCLCDCTTQVPQDYACPDGTLVPWCACGPLGRDCIARPEERCPSLCNPGQAEPYPCADGSTVPWCSCARDDCVPECRNGGTDAEGWYDPCTDAPIANRACQSCRPFCQAIGTRSEGWYDDCGGGRIEWAFCAPRRTCDDNAPGACPDSACTPLDPPVTWACPDGTAVPECACDKGTWACAATPWAGCTDHATPCVGEGGGTRLSNPSQCCPGFAMIGAASWDGAQCQYPDCLCALCTYCGDGHCVPPENRCNCPDDCMP